MAMGHVVATQLTNRAVRVKTLTIGGLDVLFQPGSGQRYGVPVDSVEVTEVGPGAVSSMSFTIDDPLLMVRITDGQQVTYTDLVLRQVIFTGYIERYSVRPAFGDRGRMFDVGCVGIEALLDWGLLSSALTIPVATRLATAVQTIVAMAKGLDEIRAVSNGTVSSQAGPIADPLYTLLDTITIPAGTSVREAIRLAIAATSPP